MKSIFSRLMMGSATVALGLTGAVMSGAPAMAVSCSNSDNFPGPTCATAPWTVTSGTTTLEGGEGGAIYSASSISVAPLSGQTAGVKLVNHATLNDDAIIGDAGTGSFDNNASTHNVTGDLILGNQSSGVGTYTIEGDSAVTSVTGNITLGLAGKGTFTQTGGAVSGVGLTLGVDGSVPNPSGYYNLTDSGSATSLTISANETIGEFGHGEFVQGVVGDAGLTTNTVSGSLIIGDGPVVNPDGNTILHPDLIRSGSYTLNSGSLSTVNTVVGSQGFGSFVQNGGTHTVTNALTVGDQNMPLSGTGTADDPFVGGPAPGTYTQNGGLVTVGSWYNGQVLANGQVTSTSPAFVANDSTTYGGIVGTLTIGAGGDGTYGLGKTGQSNTTTWAGYPGQGPDGTPSDLTPAFDDATNAPYAQVYGNVVIGRDAGSNGTLHIAGDGSQLQINYVVGFSDQGTMVVGSYGTGTVVQSDSSTVYLDGTMALGVNEGAQGFYTIGGGSLSVGGDLMIGGSGSTVGPTQQVEITGGNGTFTQNGGDVHVADALGIGQFGGTGEYDLNNGTLEVDGITYVSGNSQGTFKQGGSSSFTTNFLDVGILAGGTGTYTMTGGTLHVTSNLGVGGPIAQGTFDQQDGTVQVDGDLNINNDNSSTTTGGAYSIESGSLTVNDSLVVGNASGGTSGTGGNFTQTGGDVIVNNELVVGSAAGDTGTYTMSGGTLTVNSTGGVPLILIGSGGDGSFTESSGATVTNHNALFIGGASPGVTTGSGFLTVTDEGTAWTNDQQVIVGGTEEGSLSVLNGGYLESHAGTSSSGTAGAIGLVAGSTGTALVDGVDSQWNMPDGALRVGAGSDGNANGAQGNLLTISNRGNVTDTAGNGADGQPTDDGAAATVGWHAGSIGTVNVNSGGTWTNNGDLVIGDAGTGTVYVGTTVVTHSEVSVAGNLILGNLSTGKGTMTIEGADSLVFAGSNQNFIVGNAGTGIFNQEGGTLDLNAAGVTLDIGALAGSHGTYNLTEGGTLIDDVIVGDAGTGTYNNTGSTHTVVGDLIVGNQSTGVGIYSLTANGLTTVSGTTTVGKAATGAVSPPSFGGTFDNNASTHDTHILILGDAAGSTGSYTLENGGTLNVGSAADPGTPFFDVGESGTGLFTQTGSTSSTTITGALDIGRCGAAATATCNDGANQYTGAAGNGTFKLQGGSVSVLEDAASSYGGFTKVGDAGTGALNISGGASFTSDSLDLAVDGGTGTVTVDGSTTTVTVSDLGVGDNGSGTFTQNDGTVTVNSQLTIGANAASNDGVANIAAGSGEYDLKGGSLIVHGDAVVGDAASGTYSQTGGTATVTGSFTLGNGTTGTGTATVSAGTLGANELVIDAANTATSSSLTISGTGAVTVTDEVTVNGSGTQNGSSLTLNAGSLTANAVTNNDHFYLEGGTVTSAVTNNAAMSTDAGGTANLKGTLTNTTAGIVTVTNNSTLDVNTVGSSVSNAGFVTVDGGSTMDATGNTYTQSAGTTKVDGQINAQTMTINGGLLEGTGTITGEIQAMGGRVKPGDSPGVLNVTGDYTQTAAIFEVDITGTGTGQHGELVGTGAASLGGSLDIEQQGGFTFADGESFRIFDFANGVSGNFSSFILDGHACATASDITSCDIGAGLELTEVFGLDTLDLLVQSTGGINPPPPPPPGTGVPEPWTIAVFGAGFAGLGFLRRRKPVGARRHA